MEERVPFELITITSDNRNCTIETYDSNIDSKQKVKLIVAPSVR